MVENSKTELRGGSVGTAVRSHRNREEAMVRFLSEDSTGLELNGIFSDRKAHPEAVTPIGRIAGLLAVLLGLCFGLWAVAEYVQHKTSIRLAETDRYIRAFETGPVADAWAALTRTEAEPGADRDYLPIETLGSQTSSEEAEIETVLAYFRGFALCVRAGNCDPVEARRYLGGLPWQFRDRHLDYLEKTFADVPFDRDFSALAPRAVEPVGP